MAAKSQDKILFGAALLLLLASAGWMALQGSKLSQLNDSNVVNPTSSDYVPAGIDAPAVATQTWPKAAAQSGGAEWVYDVFTPPEIYYDAVSKKFSVTPPVLVVVDTPPPAPFGVELVQIKPDAFRLQLVGYVGSEGDYRGTFENTVSGETVIGRAGKVIPSLGLMIKSFEVKRNAIKSPDSMITYDTEATAVVVDTKSGDQVTLTNKRRSISGEPFAVLKADSSDQPGQYRAGATFQVGEVKYTVVSVTAEPPSAQVRKESADLKEPITKTLTPFVPVAPIPDSPAAEPQKPAPAPATSSFPFGT
jgi:hypothetical protein